MKYSHRIHAAVFAFTSLTISSCQNNSAQTDNKVSESYEAAEGGLQKEQKKESQKNPKNRKLIWTADLEFQVKNVNKSTEEINALSATYNGFVSNMYLANNSNRISNTITVRIPNSKFQLLVSAIKGESIYMDRANISSEDVTEEFVDIDARLKAKREVRDRYIEVLKTKTGSVKDIIEAEEAIRVITEEIEAKEGRLRFLNDRVDLSTVTITMYEKVKFKDSPKRFEKGYGDEVGESFGTGWQAVKVLLLGIIAIWPLLFIGLIAWGVWRRKKIAGLFKKS
jgi:hypothetical protein